MAWVTHALREGYLPRMTADDLADGTPWNREEVPARPQGTPLGLGLLRLLTYEPFAGLVRTRFLADADEVITGFAPKLDAMVEIVLEGEEEGKRAWFDFFMPALWICLASDRTDREVVHAAETLATFSHGPTRSAGSFVAAGRNFLAETHFSLGVASGERRQFMLDFYSGPRLFLAACDAVWWGAVGAVIQCMGPPCTLPELTQRRLLLLAFMPRVREVLLQRWPLLRKLAPRMARGIDCADLTSFEWRGFLDAAPGYVAAAAFRTGRAPHLALERLLYDPPQGPMFEGLALPEVARPCEAQLREEAIPLLLTLQLQAPLRMVDELFPKSVGVRTRLRVIHARWHPDPADIAHTVLLA